MPEDTPPKKEEELWDELSGILSNYLKHKGTPGNFLSFFESCYNLLVEKFSRGCVKITVQCLTLDGLEHLWSDTLSGHLDKVAEKYLASTIKTKLGIDTVKFKVTIKEEDYLACKMSFLQLSGKFFHTFLLALYHF